MPFAAAVLATTAHAQPPLQQLRALAARGDVPALVDATKRHPADARELVRRLLVESSRSRAPRGDSALVFARRAASAYASAWADSFPLHQVNRFSRLTPDQRARRTATDSIRRAGNDAVGRAGVGAALVLWREALRRATASEDSTGISAAMGNVGAGFYLNAELDSADVYLTRAHDLAQALGDRRTAANALVTLGSVARDRDDLARAQSLYARALDLHSRIGDARGAAADRNNLGLLSASLGDLGEARRHYDEALALARRHALDDPAAAALINLGNAASLEGEYAHAATRYAEALAIYRNADQHGDAALVLHNLGLLALRRGDYRAARGHLTEALTLFARTGTPADLVLIRRDLASVAAVSGDLRGALAHLRQADVLVGQTPDDPEMAAGVALARADLAVQLNTFGEAERLYARAEALYREAGNGARQAEAQQGRALLLVERKQFARALELLRSAARLQAIAGDRRPAALTQLLIGHAEHERGDLDGARRVLSQAGDSLRVLGDPVAEAMTLRALADVELEAHAPLAAEALYRRGLARLEGRPAATVSWQLRAGLGRVLHLRGALDEAAGVLRSATADIERMAGSLPVEERRTTFLADKWEVYAELALVERARRDVVSAFAISERMRARQMLALLARGRVERHVSADSGLVEREQDLRRRIGELTRRLEEEAGEATDTRGADLGGGAGRASGLTRESLARAQEQYAQVLLDMRDSETGYGGVLRGDVAPWREVANRLAPGEALLEYLVSDSTTLVFVITPDSLRVVDLGVSRGALESLVDFARGALVRPKSAQPRVSAAPAWRAPLRRLHDHLLAPIESAGALEGVTRLIIVPHVELHYLPFAALIRPGRTGSGERDQFLIERFEIGYAPSASIWVRLGERRLPSNGTVLAVAPRTSALPGSRAEVEAIRALYGSGATVVMNAAASEAAFRAAAPEAGIVHLATYGVLNKHNPLFSYVSLGSGGGEDGRLEVHEVFGLSLSARLVVLSACQTALAAGAVSDVPAGDDWVGLVRAFLGVGAANVIATLWPVEDLSTAALMGQLHRGLRADLTEITALTRAQREALRNSATADPFYWAGFVLVGGR